MKDISKSLFSSLMMVVAITSGCVASVIFLLALWWKLLYFSGHVGSHGSNGERTHHISCCSVPKASDGTNSFYDYLWKYCPLSVPMVV